MTEPYSHTRTESVPAGEPFRQLVESVSEFGMFLIDVSGHIVSWNAGAERISGFADNDVLGQPCAFLCNSPGTLYTCELFDDQSLRETGHYEGERVLIHKNGSECMVGVAVTSLQSGNTQLGCAVTLRELLDQRPIEEELRRMAMLHGALPGGSGDAIYIKDLAGRYLLFSDAASYFVGLPVASIVGKDDAAVFEPETARAVMARDRRLIESDLAETEEEVLSARGVTRTFLSTKAPYKDESGRVVGLIGISRDITEQKRAEFERASRTNFFSSMDQVNRAIQSTSDLEAMLTNVLDAALAIFSCDRAWLLYPCDPAAQTWHVPMERTRPEYPGAHARNLHIPMDPEGARVLATVLAKPGPVQFGPAVSQHMPSIVESFGVKSFIAMAVYPKGDQPYVFGLHQCSHMRVWTVDEELVFQEVGRRLADALTGLLARRRLQESELRYREVFDNLSDGILLLDINPDHEFTVADLNPAQARLGRQRFANARGQRLTEIFTPDLADQVQVNCHSCIELGSLISFDEEILIDDKVRFFHTTFIPLRNSMDAIYRIARVSRDVTERHTMDEKLHATELRFRTFVDQASDAFFLQDQDGFILDVNRQACESLGHTREELIGRSPADFDPHVDSKRLKDLIVEFRDLDDVAFESEHMRKDGSVFPVEVRSRKLWVDGTRFAVTLVRDITERRRADGALRASEQRLRAFFETANVGMAETSAQGRIIRANDALCTILGYARDECVGLTLADLVFAEDRGKLQAAWADVEVRRSNGYQAELRVSRKDGTARWVLLDMVAMSRDSTDSSIGTSVVMIDLSERRRAVGLMQSVLESVTDAIITVDEAGLVQSMNPATEHMFLLSGEQVIGHRIDTLIGAPFGGKHDSSFAGTAGPDRTGTLGSVHEVSLSRKDGSQFPAELTMTQFSLDDGGYFTCVIRDMTERRVLEQQLLLAQKMEAIGQMAGGIAHDFNNLLTVIIGYSEFLMNSLQSHDGRRRSVAGVLDAGERAARLTSQLLAFSRKAIVAPKVLNLNDLIASTGSMLRRLIGEDVTLTTELKPGLAPVKIDPGQLEQLVMNLAVNARDAMPKGGRLTFTTTDLLIEGNERLMSQQISSGRYVALSVSDTGCGMTNEVRARIFEPFFTTKGIGSGTGLGLATVYGIVKQAGGSIVVSSAVDQGTTFTVYLPAVLEQQPLVTAAASEIDPNGTETILLVEDEDAVRELARIALEMHGYTVLEAATGREAEVICSAHAGTIHLLLTDVVMPDLGGADLVDLVRTYRAQVKVLYMSGYTDDAVVRHGVSHAADSFLQKPFTPMSLARKVRAVLNGTDVQPA